ncbi:hypothetical protein HNQ74_000365 [Bartonella doshiae]|uniref:Uncharacterized protein n=2 Tax=Bartonella doshiae TaxID=33044 RepID=A0A380ZGR7_BARDO|nr:hypothetical protein MCS_01294 [Bartonella doshiae NCTC 12862 = ATCC 700133]MBB6158959.1 hypothetical protein [Bartonella doshiae]SUV45502.1 Uncharacterised protein [Bartonella doshiae]
MLMLYGIFHGVIEKAEKSMQKFILFADIHEIQKFIVFL